VTSSRSRPTMEQRKFRRDRRQCDSTKWGSGVLTLYREWTSQHWYPWSNILASAAGAIRSTFHTTLGATPGQLVYGQDMLFDLSFKVNWKAIKERKLARIEDSNQGKNAKRLSHTYRVGDLVSKDQNQLQPKLHRPRDGPNTIDKVYTNGTLKYVKELCQRKFLFVE
jgi:hypothetical protein